LQPGLSAFDGPGFFVAQRELNLKRVFAADLSIRREAWQLAPSHESVILIL
jgi:hypothetical protein